MRANLIVWFDRPTDPNNNNANTRNVLKIRDERVLIYTGTRQ